jgi:hypothetical protein
MIPSCENDSGCAFIDDFAFLDQCRVSDSSSARGSVMVANPNVRPISSEQRKQFEGMGVEAVRQFVSGNVWPRAQDGSAHPMTVSALIWLAEQDEDSRKRTEALRAEQTRLAKSTLRAAWIAASLAAAGIIVAAGISYGQYRIAKFEVAHNKRIRDGISLYIEVGHNLMKGISSDPTAVLSGENDWISSVNKFLQTTLHDDSYIKRFNDQFMGPLTGNSANDEVNAYSDLASRIKVLEEIRW